jgi:hypothetical protein
VPEDARDMTTTELITPPDGSHAAEPLRDARAGAHPPSSEHPARDELLGEIVPVIGVVAVAGPPVVLLAGPLVLLALMVAGPFVLVLTLVAVLIGSTALVALIGAILASPYLLVRHLRERRAGAQSSFNAPSPRLRSAAQAIQEG